MSEKNIEVSYKEVVDSLAQDLAVTIIERNMYKIQCIKLEEELTRLQEVQDEQVHEG